jgi:hypothetical protein
MTKLQEPRWGKEGYGTVATTALPLPRTLSVRNTGTAPVVFQSPSCRINGLAFATVGDFTANCSALDGVSLAPGGTRSVTVTFDPPNAGNRNAILEILTAEPTGVDLTAVATGPVGSPITSRPRTRARRRAGR